MPGLKRDILMLCLRPLICGGTMAKLHSRMYGWKYVWNTFADEHKGEVDDPNPDSSHEPMSMHIPLAETPWLLTYTMSPGGKTKSDHTRVDVSYKPLDDKFSFAIHPEHFHHGFGKLLGMQDIVIGHDDFDKAFIIKGSDEGIVKNLFEDAALRRLILDEPSIQLWAHCENTDSSPSSRALREEYNILSLRIKGAIDDFERLKTIQKLMHRILASLCRVEVAVAN